MLRDQVSSSRPEQRCPYCRDDLRGDDDDQRPCDGCGTTLHVACWRELPSCPVFGCTGRPPREGVPPPSPRALSTTRLDRAALGALLFHGALALLPFSLAVVLLALPPLLSGSFADALHRSPPVTLGLIAAALFLVGFGALIFRGGLRARRMVRLARVAAEAFTGEQVVLQRRRLGRSGTVFDLRRPGERRAFATCVAALGVPSAWPDATFVHVQPLESPGGLLLVADAVGRSAVLRRVDEPEP